MYSPSYNPLLFSLINTLFVLLLTSCVGAGEVATNLRSRGPAGETPKDTERVFCKKTSDSTVGTLISGTALFEAREASLRGLGGVTEPQPVRHAEFEVLNAEGDSVYCGETTNKGQFSFRILESSEEYKLVIYTKANNEYIKIIIMNKPGAKYNQVYAMAYNFTPDEDKDLGKLIARAKSSSGAPIILGGAFNIFEQIHKANDYLITETASCSGLSYCEPFSQKKTLFVYWEQGFNPSTYLDPAATYVSSFMEEEVMYIAGGREGDYNSTDTDHFDNSVIIHEYAHFLEWSEAVISSPGGSHNGDHVVDPRLAFSEGWSNFFQAAVLNSPYYIDTFGNIDGRSTGVVIYSDLEKVCPQGSGSGCDRPVSAGEGNFREFSVARFLWDVVDEDVDTNGYRPINREPASNYSDNISDSFTNIWAVITSSKYVDPDFPFKSTGFFHSVQKNMPDPYDSDWDVLRTSHKHIGNMDNFARYLKVSDEECANFVMSPAHVTGVCDPETQNFCTHLTYSDLFRNNDFYHYKHEGGTLSLKLERQDDRQQIDVDLYIYNSRARLRQKKDMVASAVDDEKNPTLEVNLKEGDYLINVHSAVMVADQTKVLEKIKYKLTVDDEQLCPTSDSLTH